METNTYKLYDYFFEVTKGHTKYSFTLDGKFTFFEGRKYGYTFQKKKPEEKLQVDFKHDSFFAHNCEDLGNAYKIIFETQKTQNCVRGTDLFYLNIVQDSPDSTSALSDDAANK